MKKYILTTKLGDRLVFSSAMDAFMAYDSAVKNKFNENISTMSNAWDDPEECLTDALNFYKVTEETVEK